MPGFFPASTFTKVEAPSIVPRCGACGLYKKCKSPKMPATGKGRRSILVIAEAPGEQEDEEGAQLIGKSGQHLRKSLRKFDVDLDRDCWKTNAVICRPPKNEIKDEYIEACRPCLKKTVAQLQPRVIILLGAAAVKSLIGAVWREQIGTLTRWVGWTIPSQQLNAWLCPNYHPAYLVRQNDPVLQLWFDRYLERALELDGTPFPDGAPNYESEVERIYDPLAVGHRLKKVLEKGGTIAFDYETDRLKPDSLGARIVSCAICWEGKRTFAFPWHGDGIQWMGEVLKSDKVRKIGANIKFEERWTRREFGRGVRGWLWDTMQAAHVLDNRSGINGLKFQSFVRLGQGPYDTTVSPFLKADNSNAANRIGEVELSTLLLYNGMDARLTWELAQLQMKEMQDGSRREYQC